MRPMATPEPRRCDARASASSCAATRALFDERGVQRRPDRGDRPGRRDRPRADLPPLLLQGGALRPHRHGLPGRARRRAARRASPATRAPPTRLEPSAPRAYAGFCGATRPSSTARCRSCTARPASCTSRLGVGLAAARPGHGALRRAARRRSCARAPRRATFDVDDPDYTANVLWTQALGLMHLARIGVGVRQAAPGRPGPLRASSPSGSSRPASRARWRRSARGADDVFALNDRSKSARLRSYMKPIASPSSPRRPAGRRLAGCARRNPQVAPRAPAARAARAGGRHRRAGVLRRAGVDPDAVRARPTRRSTRCRRSATAARRRRPRAS